MRSIFSASLTLMLALLPAATISAEPSVALRAEGYVGYSNLQIDFPGFFRSVDEDAFQGGGTGSASVVFDKLYLQADVFGDVTDYNRLEADTVGGGLHLGWRDAERGSAGLAGAYNQQDVEDLGIDIGRGGFEGEIFIDRLTLSANVGYASIEDDDTGYFDAGVAFYPTERARLQFGGGVFDLDADDPLGTVGANAEYLVATPLAAFTRWEASFVESSGVEVDQHSIVVGLRLYWGAHEPSLLAYDRSHFKRTCSGVLLIAGRVC